MKNNELTFEVAVRVGPSREDAERALMIVNWYLKDNPDIEPSILTSKQGAEGPEHYEVIIGKERRKR